MRGCILRYAKIILAMNEEFCVRVKKFSGKNRHTAEVWFLGLILNETGVF